VYDFDASGTLTAYHDVDGGGLTFDYTSANGQSRLSAIHDPAGSATRFSYDGDGFIIEADDPASNHYYFGYDTAHHLISVSGPNSVVHYGYDSSGRLAAVDAGSGEHIAVGYDGSGRVLIVADTLDAATRSLTFDYRTDPSDCGAYEGATSETVVTDTDEDGSRSVYCFDAAGRALSPTEPN